MKVQAYISYRGQGGRVTMALMKTFWTSSFGMLTDKFGVPWMVNVAAPKA